MKHWRKPRIEFATLLKAAGTMAGLAVLTFLAFKPDVFGDSYATYRAERLIRSAEAQSRTTEGRLANAPYSRLTPNAALPDDLGRAQLVLLRLGNSPRTEYLQSLIDIGTKNWSRAATTLSGLVSRPDADPK